MTDGGTHARRPRAADLVAVLRQCPDFRRLFLARYASLLGDWFNLLAVLALLREIGRTDARSIGVLLILKLLPATLFGPLAGVVADRVPRRAVMIAADASRFVLVLALFTAPVLPLPLALAVVYGVTALQIAAQAFSEPARLASIPNLVPPDLLGAANAVSALTWSLVFTLGAGLGGAVTALAGWRLALAVDALTYLVSILLVLPVRLPPPPETGGPPGLATLTGARDVALALAHLAERPATAVLLAAKTGWGLAGGITLTLTMFGERIFDFGGRPSLGVAVLYMARGIGTAIGPIVARAVTRERDRPMIHAISASFVLAAVAYVLFAFAPNVAVAAFLVVTAHLGGSTIWVFSTILLQRRVPDRFRGRVFAFDLGLATLLISITTWVFGELLEREIVPLRTLPLILAGAIAVAGGAWAALSRGVARGEAAGDGDPARGDPG